MALTGRMMRRGGLAGPPTRRERLRHLLIGETELGLGWLRGQERALEAWRDEIVASRDPDLALIERLEAHRRWLTEEIWTLTKS